MLYSMWQYLTVHGCVLHCARSLDEAEEFWNRGSYDAIITDLRLKGIRETEGLDLVTYIRQRCPSSRIILLTNYGSPHIEAEARRRGADAFLYRGETSEASATVEASPVKPSADS